GWGGFPADGSPGTLLTWSVRALVGIGYYGTTGMGIPLVLLGLLGLIGMCRRSPALAALLGGPLALVCLAGLLRQYPLAERTGFFVVHCLWLLAVAGFQMSCRGR